MDDLENRPATGRETINRSIAGPAAVKTELTSRQSTRRRPVCQSPVWPGESPQSINCIYNMQIHGDQRASNLSEFFQEPNESSKIVKTAKLRERNVTRKLPGETRFRKCCPGGDGLVVSENSKTECRQALQTFLNHFINDGYQAFGVNVPGCLKLGGSADSRLQRRHFNAAVRRFCAGHVRRE